MPPRIMWLETFGVVIVHRMKFAYFTYNKEWLNNQNSGRAFAVLAIMLIDYDNTE